MAYSRLRECRSTLILPLPLVSVHNNSTLVPSPRIGWFIKPFTHQIICQRRQPWGAWWGFAPGLLLTFGVGFVIVVFDPHASSPFVKICLWLLHSQIRVACSHLRELHSTLILPLPLLCVHNNPTLVPTLRIEWFIKPFTHQTNYQRRQSWGRFVEVCSRFPSVGVVILVLDPHASFPFMKLCLSLLHSEIRVAYSRLHEPRSIFILPLPLGCVRNNPTLVAALRIGWFIKPFTHQTICQRRQPLGLMLEVCYWFPTNIRCFCRDCGVSPPFHGSYF
jgi:hypothetical protein